MSLSEGAFADACTRARRGSPFLRKLLEREPHLLATMEQGRFDDAFNEALARLSPEDASPSLRLARQGVALTVALADLAGVWPLEKVIAHLSAFADRALQFAMEAAFREQNLGPPRGLVALALGKLGSHELNYSSDIDLIFIHDPETLPHKPHEEAGTAAVRLVRRISALLSEHTEHGYALRVDLRLRPDPSSTPPSIPLSTATYYYRSEALAWERAAFIRARVAAGDLALGTRFMESIASFLWRRSLDYSALAEIRDISHRIRERFTKSSLPGRNTPGPGFDIKRGHGGIREVEFFAQVYQLIFGGRDPKLRVGATLDALAALAAAGRVAASEARTLASAYRFLRTLEHRIQMTADQQTHSIPADPEACDTLAQLSGYPDWPSLEKELVQHLDAVAGLYDHLLETGDEERGPRLPLPRSEVERWAREKEISEAELLATLVETWRSGHYRALHSPAAMRAFEAILPGLAVHVGKGPHGHDGLLRLDQMIRTLPSGVLFWRLLAAHPQLTRIIAGILTSTPLLADALAAHPGLVDVLITPGPFLPDLEATTQALAQVTQGLTGELLLDRVRQWTAERRFQIGVDLLHGHLKPLAAARALSLMAEATVALFTRVLTAEMEAQHGPVPGCSFVVLALGRFGGGGLTTQSDLDLVMLFTGSFETQSAGPSPIGASLWFNRLAQRLVSALTVPTAAGRLYEVDTRLRPSGNAGLVATSLQSFERYQLHDADIWETMALTKARPVAGPAEARAQAHAALQRILSTRRDPKAIRREALVVRQHMLTHKPGCGTFDVKLARGGLVDIEFIAQTRMLSEGKLLPPFLTRQLAAVAPELESPARFLMSVLVMLRFMQPHDENRAPTGAGAEAISRACGFSSLAELKQAIDTARKTVRCCWDATFGAGSFPEKEQNDDD